jgi:hypothetical protein
MEHESRSERHQNDVASARRPIEPAEEHEIRITNCRMHALA